MEKENWTPLKIIQWAVPYLKQKGFENARFDAECLVAYALGLDRLKVYLQFDRPLIPSELSTIRELIKRRSSHEPLQYITGNREFFGLNFKVTPSVLIPRPETEILVENVIKYLEKIPEEERTVLDLGTGSGCIGISIAKSVKCQIWAVDISEEALEVAKENGAKLETPHIRWRKGSWFTALEKDDPKQFKVVVSNPPYIAENERKDLPSEVANFEPDVALFAGSDGMNAYKELKEDIWNWLTPKGVAFLELHSKQVNLITSLFEEFDFKKALIPDLQGLERVLILEK